MCVLCVQSHSNNVWLFFGLILDSLLHLSLLQSLSLFLRKLLFFIIDNYVSFNIWPYLPTIFGHGKPFIRKICWNRLHFAPILILLIVYCPFSAFHVNLILIFKMYIFGELQNIFFRTNYFLNYFLKNLCFGILLLCPEWETFSNLLFCSFGLFCWGRTIKFYSTSICCQLF